jgi:hypothetical protein
MDDSSHTAVSDLVRAILCLAVQTVEDSIFGVFIEHFIRSSTEAKTLNEERFDQE